MTSALLSMALNKAPIRNMAMTGEITLTGQVLPVGGIREKVIAAKRSKISQLILPETNRRDFDELPKHIAKGIKVDYASKYDDVFEALFSR